MSILDSYKELNHIFLGLTTGDVETINSLYVTTGSNYTKRIESLFHDIGISPIGVDSEDLVCDFMDYLVFTRKSFQNNGFEDSHNTSHEYMFPFPQDLTLLIELITDLVFSPKDFSAKDLALINRIIKFIHLKIKRKEVIHGYENFVTIIHKIYPVIERDFQKNDSPQSQMLYALRNLLDSTRYNHLDSSYGFFQSTIDEILVHYGVLDLYLEFSQNDFTRSESPDGMKRELVEDGGFEEISISIVTGIDNLISDIKLYLNEGHKSEQDHIYVGNMLCQMIFHFSGLVTCFEDAHKCRNLVLFKLSKLFLSTGFKKSDYQSFLQVNYP